MEKIVYRGLKFVFSDHNASYEELLDRANMTSLELMREKAIITDIYKCVNGLGPDYLSELYTVKQQESRRGPTLLQPREGSAKYGTHSLRIMGPRIWNKLSKDIKSSKSINILKTRLEDYKGLQCKCALCK